MHVPRLVNAHRPIVILVLLVSLSIVSLATGTEANFIQHGVKRAVSITAYPFLKTRQMIEGGSDYMVGLVFNYEAQRQQNAALQQSVLSLQQELMRRAELREENVRLRSMMHFMRAEPRFSLEPVQVIGSMKGMITIDRGSYHGIKESMAVVTEDGVVGVITEVLDFTSNVATLHHRDCRVGAMVQRNRVRAYDGVIHASGSDLNSICTLDYIDMASDEVQPGDIVVTTPESLFPSGTRIGTISAIRHHPSSSLYKRAEVIPFVDPYRLDEVFVVWRALPPAEELAGPVHPRGAVSQAPELPDYRSLQERYAP